jgi:hypothetical protein
MVWYFHGITVLGLDAEGEASIYDLPLNGSTDFNYILIYGGNEACMRKYMHYLRAYFLITNFIFF